MAAAHGMLDLTRPLTAGLGMVLTMLAHHRGWPLPEGGTQRMADAMVTALEQQGGSVEYGHEVTDLREFDGVPAVLLDTSPDAFVAMAGDRLAPGYGKWVRRYKHGPGVFKVDWALSDPVPWANPDVRRAGTVHVAGTLAETIAGEAAPAAGRLTDEPYVLAVQPTVLDPTRAPEGKHVFWAYVHVPHGSDVDMTEQIEAQVERFAPGFRDTILARATKTAPQMQDWNPNNVGGDISNGEASLLQMLARPVPRWNTYSTPMDHVFLASAATPPGRRCTACAATTRPGSPCGRSSASARSRPSAPPRPPDPFGVRLPLDVTRRGVGTPRPRGCHIERASSAATRATTTAGSRRSSAVTKTTRQPAAVSRFKRARSRANCSVPACQRPSYSSATRCSGQAKSTRAISRPSCRTRNWATGRGSRDRCRSSRTTVSIGDSARPSANRTTASARRAPRAVSASAAASSSGWSRGTAAGTGRPARRPRRGGRRRRGRDRCGPGR